MPQSKCLKCKKIVLPSEIRTTEALGDRPPLEFHDKCGGAVIEKVK